MSDFNTKFAKQVSEDSNSPAVENSIMGINPQKCGKTPQTPQTPFGDSDAPTFSNRVIKQLPKLIMDAISRVDKPRDKSKQQQYYGLLDIMILTILGVSSSAFTKVRFLYRRGWYYPPLMLCIIALAGMGKGIMESIFYLIEPIREWWNDKYQAELYAYKKQQQELKKMSKKDLKEYNEEILEKPSHYLFRIPTDSTYAAFIKVLSIMHGEGAVVDSEIDTILQSFTQDLGDYSVLLRKNFKHEHHEWYRKTDDEYGSIEEPKFSMIMSGTMDQLRKLLNSIENGLFSRVPPYFYKAKPQWEDAKDESGCEEDDKSFFINLGSQIFKLYQKLESLSEPVRFCLTTKQIKKMNKYFGNLHANYLALEGEDIHASIVRLAVIFQRIALILTLLRLLELDDEKLNKSLQGKLECSDKDFDIALIISQTLIQHIAAYYEVLQGREAQDNDEELTAPADFGRQDVNEGYDSLPYNRDLTRQDIIDAQTQHGVPYSTAEKYITRFIKAFRLRKLCHNKYRKLSDQEYLILKQEDTAKKKRKKAKK